MPAIVNDCMQHHRCRRTSVGPTNAVTSTAGLTVCSRSNFICEFCLANRHLRICKPYDFRPNSQFRRFLTTHALYLLVTVGRDRSPFCKVRGWTIFRNKLDNLHALYLGFGKDVGGSLLVILAKTYYPGVDLAIALGYLYYYFRQWCKARKSSCTMKKWNLRTVCVENSYDYPTLASWVKGAKCRLILLWLAHEVRDTSAVEPAHTACSLMLPGVTLQSRVVWGARAAHPPQGGNENQYTYMFCYPLRWGSYM